MVTHNANFLLSGMCGGYKGCGKFEVWVGLGDVEWRGEFGDRTLVGTVQELPGMAGEEN